MTPAFYQSQVSLYAMKVRIGLMLKGVAVDTPAIPGGSIKSAEYRAVVPTGMIPALMVEDGAIFESSAILEYLEERYAQPALLPGDAFARARIRTLAGIHDTRLEPQLRVLFPYVFRMPKNETVIAEQTAKLVASLAIIEALCDETGPYVAGPAPTLADCGLAATCFWLDAMAPGFGSGFAPGPRYRRAFEAMAAHPALAESFARYRETAAGWVAGTTAG